MINAQPDFELTTAPTLSLLTYRVCPEPVKTALKTASDVEKARVNQKLDKLVVAVQKAQREAGKSLVSRTRLECPELGGQAITVFRVVLANPLTTEEDLKNILAEQDALAKGMRLYKELVQYAEKVNNSTV